MSVFLIVLGLIFALLSWVLFASKRDLKNVLLELAEHGPCTSLELLRRRKRKFFSMYSALSDGVEQSLIVTRYRSNDQQTAEVRGELKTPVYRLSTLGWQAVTRLRAGKSLELDESE